MTIWRMRIAYWISKATHTLRISNTHCSSTATMVARTRLTVTLYVHCFPCLLCNCHMGVSARKQALICHYFLLNLLTVATDCDTILFCCFVAMLPITILFMHYAVAKR